MKTVSEDGWFYEFTGNFVTSSRSTSLSHRGFENTGRDLITFILALYYCGDRSEATQHLLQYQGS